MRGRRGVERGSNEVFGTSLADILTTALGCVLLLFLVAVMTVGKALSKEQSSHADTRDLLASVEAGRAAAEAARTATAGRLADETAARARREAALATETAALAAARKEQARLSAALEREKTDRAARDKALADESARKKQSDDELVKTQAALEAVQRRYDTLSQTARRAVDAWNRGTPEAVDVMLVIDGTSSMAESIDAAKRELAALLWSLKVLTPSPRIGVVVYRDKREEPSFRIQQHPLTDDLDSLSRFLAGVEASSTLVNQDEPEWVFGGLRAAAMADWRSDAMRVMVLVGDAASQDGSDVVVEEARRFKERGGRVFVMSVRPRRYAFGGPMAQRFDDEVLPEHRKIAAAGGGEHIAPSSSEGLLRHVIQALMKTRKSQPVDDLRDALAPPPADAAPAPPRGE